ncbi:MULTISPECIES: hypothetical protein [unclassified Aureispira]|uniref:hypothetical protein n=1 Tax=unclassified Aureispira TaxID=2649989 RepID=UPI0012DEF60A|nr:MULTISPECIES: hypothetical protein [unclassified Aureispira]WMX17001.1 hypothetical protein QP953_11520 [Aureispira sp. CCB-E]
MKHLITLTLVAVVFFSCGSESVETTSEVSPELIEETKTLESENEELEETIQNIETTRKELDEMLEDL